MAIVVACHSSTNNNAVTASHNPLAKVKMKMTKMEVTALTGEPTAKEDLGSSINMDTIRSESSDTVTVDSTHLERWSFGNNMEILFSNDSVSGIDTNIAYTQQHLQHVMDSARQIDGMKQQGVILQH